MAQKVSVLDGEVNRNWHIKDSNGEKHLLSLFHDCVTGARAAMLDYEVKAGQIIGVRVSFATMINSDVIRSWWRNILHLVERELTHFRWKITAVQQ